MDIRVNSQVLNHPKIKKLVRFAGYEEGFLRLFKLWCWAADNRPKGILDNMDIEDIAIAMDYPEDRTEDCGKLVETLVALRLLDAKNANGDATIYAIHDWKDHQPFLYHKDNRKKAAKIAAEARWQRKTGKRVNADRMRNASHSHAEGIRDASDSHASGNAPSPIPIPLPNPNPNPSLENSNSEHVNGEVLEQPPEPPTEEDGRTDLNKNSKTDGRKDGQDIDDRYSAIRDYFKKRFKKDISNLDIDRLIFGDPKIKFSGMGNVETVVFAIANYKSKKQPDDPIGLLISIGKHPEEYFQGDTLKSYYQQGVKPLIIKPKTANIDGNMPQKIAESMDRIKENLKPDG